MNTERKQRAALLAATPAGERSEVAARFDHQTEADWLATAEPTEAERHEAILDINTDDVIEFVKNSGYREDQVYARLRQGMLPGHLRAELTRVQTQPHPDNRIVAAVHERRARRLKYIQARYGVTPTK